MKQKIKNEPLIEKNHFELAKISNDARWSSFFSRLKALKMMNFGLLVLCGILIFTIISISKKPKIVPYIIEINESGRIANYGKVLEYNNIDIQPELVQFYVENFFENIRNIDSDVVVVKRNWSEVYNFCTDKAAAILNRIYTERKPLQLLTTTTVEIRFTSYLNKSTRAKEIEWAEDYFDLQGNKTETKFYRAMLTYLISPENISKNNPSGFFIDSLIIGEKNNG